MVFICLSSMYNKRLGWVYVVCHVCVSINRKYDKSVIINTETNFVNSLIS